MTPVYTKINLPTHYEKEPNNLYKKLRMLEKDGFLESHLKPSNRGVDRKYYSITSFDKKLYDEMCQILIPVVSSLHKRLKRT